MPTLLISAPSLHSSAPAHPGKWQFIKALAAVLGLLIAANILVLGVVGILKANGVPKSIANPLQIAYLPLMWAGLRWLKRKYGITARLLALPVRSALRRALLAGLLVGGMAALIIALLHWHYGLPIAFELLMTEGRRWFLMVLILGQAAAVEELVFRDYLLNATRKLTPNFYAITTLNASVFLLLHIQGFLTGDYTLLWALSIFSMGLFLAAYVLVVRDLVFPMCFHACWNISTTLYGEDDKTFNLVKFDHYLTHELLISNVTAAVCIGLMAGLFAVLAYRHHRKA